MLLELHSKINIFTQKKGINNLWKKITSNSKLLLFCSHLVTSLHVTVNNCPLPAPSSMSFSSRHLKLPACLWMPHDILYKGEGTTARWHLEACPTLTLGRGDHSQAPILSCWDIILLKNKTQDKLEHLMVLFFLKWAINVPHLPQ